MFATLEDAWNHAVNRITWHPSSIKTTEANVMLPVVTHLSLFSYVTERLSSLYDIPNWYLLRMGQGIVIYLLWMNVDF